MSSSLIDHLTHACEAFAAQPGQISVLVQSKSDPSLCAAIEADQPLPSASLVKVAIACAAVDADHVDLAKPIKVSDLDETFYCSILQAFDHGDTISLKTLTGLMLIVSDNPAATALIEAVGLENVNDWLQSNSLGKTHIEMGFSDDNLGAPLRANLTTAEDCLHLLKLVDTRSEYAFIKHMLANNLRNERIPKLLPDEAVIAHKTGTLNGLMHDIALIESPQAAFYLIVLADQLPEDHDFANATARFAKEIYDLMTA